MVVDTSAILAIIFDEPERAKFALKLASSSRRVVSAATLFETTVVLRHRTKSRSSNDLENLLSRVSFSVVPFDERQLRLADQAYARYGRGSGHAAQLNFGDCFAYALAKHLDMPLLFKGDDFIQTDLVAA